MRRQIIYSREFDDAVEALGGYRTIDIVIDTVIEALARNPYAFKKFENDYTSFRYVITKPVEDIIYSLIIVFSIGEDNNVTLEHIEENLSY